MATGNEMLDIIIIKKLKNDHDDWDGGDASQPLSSQAMMEAVTYGYEMVMNEVASNDNVMTKDIKKELKARFWNFRVQRTT